MNLLDVHNLRVQFDGRAVVHGLSLSIAAGEKLALVGESGSGKSVSALGLLGLVPGAEVGGQALFGGRDLLALPPAALQAVRGRDIAVIFQEPMTALNPVLRIGEQIAEVLRVKMGLGRRQAWAGAIERLRETGIPQPEQRARFYPHQLSGGQRQRAMIAMALACEPKLLIADEPTTALDATLRLQILDLLDELQRRNGMAILMITHDLNLVRRFADRVAVMEQGHLVEQGPVDALFARPAHPYTQRLLASRPQRDLAGDGQAPPDDDRRLQTARLSVSYPAGHGGLRSLWRRERFLALRDASLDLPPGRTLGIIGESGSGKSTLARAVLGLVRHEGEVLIDGQRWRDAHRGGEVARRALRRRIQVVFQDPFSSLSPRKTVDQIVGEALRFHEPGLDEAACRARILAMLADVGLDEAKFPDLLRRLPHEFSGGQRQRIAIARALIIRPGVLVLDEPTSALDVTIQKQILALLVRLQKSHGLSYLLITHDMDVVRAMAHHIAVLKDGEVVESEPALQLLAAPRHPYTRRLLEAAG
ncbi:MAG: putative ABC transporter ATP-binding protein YejF [Paracidovorax wautersii]|uniref:Putative ABC transporter ATP-binding protein YejF n=1 Tax=Paracidovorax wautersii TaxID=1177982 RepID=A0A7V8FPE7_9BURK|nr:MAG: putative ABC transporter ATP-binding protein YejF [Paracidovorax wautersii]